MNKISNFPILIVDDDNLFRQVVTNLLQARHYEVIEARTAKEATQALSERKPALVIVDYQLPDTDGMTWIEKIRGSGENTPIIFISSSWCDPKTFSWLRNILKVSLILQKPIVPELFLQQIEGLLPHTAIESAKQQAAKTATMDAAAAQIDEELSRAFPVCSESLEEVDALLNSPDTDQDLREHLTRFRKKLHKQHTLNEVKSSYRDQLLTQWKELTRTVATAQANPTNRLFFSEAASLAHKLQGSAGTVGFGPVSVLAAKIQDLLRTFDPNNPADHVQEILWTEIFRILANGESAIKAVLAVPEAKPASASRNANRVLLVGAADIEPMLRNPEVSHLAEFVFADGAAGAVLKAKSTSFDAAIIDLRQAEHYGVGRLTKEVREAAGQRTLALCDDQRR